MWRFGLWKKRSCVWEAPLVSGGPVVPLRRFETLGGAQRPPRGRRIRADDRPRFRAIGEAEPARDHDPAETGTPVDVLHGDLDGRDRSADRDHGPDRLPGAGARVPSETNPG